MLHEYYSQNNSMLTQEVKTSIMTNINNTKNMSFSPEQFVETLRLFVEHNSQDIFHFIENNRRPMELGSENQLFGRLMRELVLLVSSLSL